MFSPFKFEFSSFSLSFSLMFKFFGIVFRCCKMFLWDVGEIEIVLKLATLVNHFTSNTVEGSYFVNKLLDCILSDCIISTLNWVTQK